MADDIRESDDTVILPDAPPFSEAAVLTWFGMAASAAQSFETALATFTVVVQLAETPGIVPSGLRGNPFRSLERRTLGQLLIRARQVVSFHPLLDGWLQEALNTRNHLFHHFFPTNHSRMENDDGRSELVDELQRATQRFLELAQALFDLIEPTVRILSLSSSEIEAELQRWRDEDLDV